MRYVSGVISFNAMFQTFRTFEQQADLLIRRGMHSSCGLSNADLKTEIVERLSYINYQRLSSYWRLSYTASTPKRFYPGTYWEDVMKQYMFDRKLRQIIFDGISRIEIALRTQIAYNWAKETQKDSPQASSNSYKPSFGYIDFLKKVNTYYINNPSEEAVAYRSLYWQASDLPVWGFVEFTTFGNLQRLMAAGFKTSSSVVATVSEKLGYPNDKDFFLSGIALLTDVRNACAHQSRVWDRRWLSKTGASILKKSNNGDWGHVWDEANGTWTNAAHGVSLFAQKDSTAAALTFCYQIIKAIAPHSNWKSRLTDLLESTDAPATNTYKRLGFSNAHWAAHPLWQENH